MKLRWDFENMELDDRVVAIPVGEGSEEFRCVIKLNESAAEIFDMLKQETTEDKIVETLLQRHKEDVKEVTSFVHDFIQELITEGILINP